MSSTCPSRRRMRCRLLSIVCLLSFTIGCFISQVFIRIGFYDFPFLLGSIRWFIVVILEYLVIKLVALYGYVDAVDVSLGHYFARLLCFSTNTAVVILLSSVRAHYYDRGINGISRIPFVGGLVMLCLAWISELLLVAEIFYLRPNPTRNLNQELVARVRRDMTEIQS